MSVYFSQLNIWAIMTTLRALWTGTKFSDMLLIDHLMGVKFSIFWIIIKSHTHKFNFDLKRFVADVVVTFPCGYCV